MNLGTFLAMLARDAHVARRNFLTILIQTLLQPMFFVFIFGRVMTTSGLMSGQYKVLLLPGIIAISMFMAGIMAVAMPLVTEFQFSREIEDRLLAPMNIEYLALEKVISGMAQSLAAGLVVLPTAYFVMGGVSLSTEHLPLFAVIALLVACLAAAVGLTLGCSIGQTQIGLMFSMVLAPMIFFGCTYYPWKTLDPFPALKWAVLVNPVVYASEGLRSAFVPTYPHIPVPVVLVALVGFDLAFLFLGLRQFCRKAVS
jgi:ABC-2 type transport system permease protein